jgi:hypothetical protein
VRHYPHLQLKRNERFPVTAPPFRWKKYSKRKRHGGAGDAAVVTATRLARLVPRVPGHRLLI